MNDILSITIDANLNHGTRAKRSAATCNKMRRNELNLGVNIIKVYTIFVTLRKIH